MSVQHKKRLPSIVLPYIVLFLLVIMAASMYAYSEHMTSETHTESVAALRIPPLPRGHHALPKHHRPIGVPIPRPTGILVPRPIGSVIL